MKHSYFRGLYVISSRSNFLCSLVVYVGSIYEPCLYDSFYVLMALYILENIRKICKAHRFIQLHFPDYTPNIDFDAIVYSNILICKADMIKQNNANDNKLTLIMFIRSVLQWAYHANGLYFNLFVLS